MLYLAREHNIRLRDIAERVGITERAAHRIVSELCEEGYLTRHRLGARNYYEVNADLPLRHPYEEHHTVGELLAPLLRRQPMLAEGVDEPKGASQTS